MISFLLKLMNLAWPYKGRLALGIFFGILTGISNPALVVTVRFVINVVFPSPEAPSLGAELENAPAFVQDLARRAIDWLPAVETNRAAFVVLAVSTIPMVMLFRGLFSYLNIYCMQWVAVRAVAELRNRLFNHLLNLSLSFFHKARTGDLISRTISDTATVQSAISNTLPVLIKDPITIIGLAALLLIQQPGLTAIALLVFPLCTLPIIIYARKVRKSSAAIQAHYADLAHLIQESFTGNRIIKAYNLENRVRTQFEETSRGFVSHYMRVIRSSEIPGPLIEFVGAIGVSLVLLYVAFGARTPMTPGDFFQFIISIFLMYAPIKHLTRLYHQLEQARAASARVFELIELKSDLQDPRSPAQLQALNQPIHFEGIEFQYGEKQVLRGIHLTIQPGQLVALVGSSGSGKTTLSNLLLRFYDPQKGAIRIGRTDIRNVTMADLRSQIAVVTQETILFNDSIRLNIALGRPNASDQEIINAAKHAFAHDFIMEKPHGYDTLIGEKGVSLSGGQRQRIAIARALLKDAPILILDEATSALDTESERAVQAALEILMQGRTTICIAHRLSTIQKADRIVVLENGQIVETGRHKELLERDGVYRKLYELQFQTAAPRQGQLEI
jgi:ATP-binding cassette, subfamily B, bacterial MsbA